MASLTDFNFSHLILFLNRLTDFYSSKVHPVKSFSHLFTIITAEKLVFLYQFYKQMSIIFLVANFKKI